MLMMLAWFWASGTPPNLEKRGFGLARAPCEKLGPMMRAREGLMGCCGCFVASVFRKNPWFLRGFRAFRTTASIVERFKRARQLKGCQKLICLSLCETLGAGGG